MWELCFQEWPCWPSNIIYLHVGHGGLSFRQSVELRNVNNIQIGVLFTLEDENWTIAAYLSKRILKAFVLIHCLNFALKQSWVQMKESLEDWTKSAIYGVFYKLAQNVSSLEPLKTSKSTQVCFGGRAPAIWHCNGLSVILNMPTVVLSDWRFVIHTLSIYIFTIPATCKILSLRKTFQA